MLFIIRVFDLKPWPKSNLKVWPKSLGCLNVLSFWLEGLFLPWLGSFVYVALCRELSQYQLEALSLSSWKNLLSRVRSYEEMRFRVILHWVIAATDISVGDWDWDCFQTPPKGAKEICMLSIWVNDPLDGSIYMYFARLVLILQSWSEHDVLMSSVWSAFQ